MKVLVLRDGQEIPEDGTFYVVSADGIYLKKSNVVGSALVRVEGIGFLQEVEPEASYCLENLSAELTSAIAAFFFAIYKRYSGAEAVVILYYNPDTQDLIARAPAQVVAVDELDYGRDEVIDGYLQVGTVHSHGAGDAYHSCVDIRDERDFDGIHCTFGDMGDEAISISCTMVFNGTRFQVDPLDVFDGLAAYVLDSRSKDAPKRYRPGMQSEGRWQSTRFPREWLESVTTVSTLKRSWVGSDSEDELFLDFEEDDLPPAVARSIREFMTQPEIAPLGSMTLDGDLSVYDDPDDLPDSLQHFASGDGLFEECHEADIQTGLASTEEA